METLFWKTILETSHGESNNVICKSRDLDLDFPPWREIVADWWFFANHVINHVIEFSMMESRVEGTSYV